jgi:hypothetical protein
MRDKPTEAVRAALQQLEAGMRKTKPNTGPPDAQGLPPLAFPTVERGNSSARGSSQVNYLRDTQTALSNEVFAPRVAQEESQHRNVWDAVRWGIKHFKENNGKSLKIFSSIMLQGIALYENGMLAGSDDARETIQPSGLIAEDREGRRAQGLALFAAGLFAHFAVGGRSRTFAQEIKSFLSETREDWPGEDQFNVTKPSDLLMDLRCDFSKMFPKDLLELRQVGIRKYTQGGKNP